MFRSLFKKTTTQCRKFQHCIVKEQHNSFGEFGHRIRTKFHAFDTHSHTSMEFELTHDEQFFEIKKEYEMTFILEEK